MITVVRAGPLTTVQDLGRPGFAHLGVPLSGALDAPALRRGNALVGNPPGAAGLETTLLGCALRFGAPTRVAVTGAAARVTLDREVVEARGGVVLVDVPAGGLLDVGKAVGGVRSYVAVAGGIAVEPVLGSRATDTLSGLGPPRLTDGMSLPVGADIDAAPAASEPAVSGLAASRSAASARVASEPAASARVASEPAASEPADPAQAASGPTASARAASRPTVPDASGFGVAAEVVLGVWVGPRDDWVEVGPLFSDAYRISPVSNRVGARLAGTALSRARAGELPSEGVVLGAIQVPADGQPLVFLADHPTTGGYPVVGVVDDVTPLAQARPGTTVRFRALH